MIYTSYFAKIRDLPDNIIPVSICGKAPEWYTGLQYKKLAPKYDFFMKWKETHDNNYYIKCFNKEVLKKLDIYTVMRELIKLTDQVETFGSRGGKDICLICYERPDDFCHRHLVANWFNRNGIKCREYEF